MRTSAFPSFRKLYGRIHINENKKNNIIETKDDSLSLQMTKNDTDIENTPFSNNSLKDKPKDKHKLKTRHKHGLPRGKYFVLVDYGEFIYKKY